MARRKEKTETCRALTNRRLRETKMCECGSYKPAIVTVTLGGKVKGYCENCIGG